MRQDNIFNNIYLAYTKLAFCTTTITLTIYLYISRQLISFVQHNNSYLWHGYVLGFTIFFISMLNMLFFVHNMTGSYAAGSRSRTALISAIYRKVFHRIVISRFYRMMKGHCLRRLGEGGRAHCLFSLLQRRNEEIYVRRCIMV